VEGSRWVGKSSRTYEGALSTALLMLQLHQLAQEHGFQQLIGVIAAKSEAGSTSGKPMYTPLHTATTPSATATFSSPPWRWISSFSAQQILDVAVDGLRIGQGNCRCANRIATKNKREMDFPSIKNLIF
jgi:hypothetical protein